MLSTYFVFNCRVMQTGVEHDNREAQYITRVWEMKIYADSMQMSTL